MENHILKQFIILMDIVQLYYYNLCNTSSGYFNFCLMLYNLYEFAFLEEEDMYGNVCLNFVSNTFACIKLTM